MFRALLAFSFLLFLFSCGGNGAPAVVKKDSVKPVVFDTQKKIDTVVKKDTLAKRVIGELEQQLIDSGLVDVQTLDSTIRVDLKYSTKDNFLGMDVYGDLERCYLQPDVAQKLVKAEEALRKKYPYYHLVIYDAVRPRHIQRKMWDTLHLPPGEKQKYLSNPESGSLHNYAAAVDLGIIDDHGIALDMGTKFDYFGDEAQPKKEPELLDSGKITHHQVANREILRSVMRQAGFFNIQTEWWHFNSCRRDDAARMYHMIE